LRAEGAGDTALILPDRDRTAILDRILHHAITVNIRGSSYRLKEKLKS